jgi:hypothetical protein
MVLMIHWTPKSQSELCILHFDHIGLSVSNTRSPMIKGIRPIYRCTRDLSPLNVRTCLLNVSTVEAGRILLDVSMFV